MIIDFCIKCYGYGWIQEEWLLLVNILVGIEDGICICLMGEGEVGLCGGLVGDFYIFMLVKLYQFFQWEGVDFYCFVFVLMMMVVFGGKFDVMMLDGMKLWVMILEGMQIGKQFCFKGKGMLIMWFNQIGDFYIQIMIEMLQKLIKCQCELLQEFEQILLKENNLEFFGFFVKMKEFFE